ncbi:hypothetical protein QAD02_021067 [Eretmocerus hayati]|uniref:Uncharacterized protein n=1 Tax=Eretmocerus hayati TaxID=131215 RepID=A0ACC2PPN3_9HYME|nr:hypothetical protein QAD02_021067 [Eretmocerus hayati]
MATQADFERLREKVNMRITNLELAEEERWDHLTEMGVEWTNYKGFLKKSIKSVEFRSKMPISKARRARQRLNRRIKRLNIQIAKVQGMIQNFSSSINKDTTNQLSICVPVKEISVEPSQNRKEETVRLHPEEDILVIENDITWEQFENLSIEDVATIKDSPKCL